MAPAFIVMGSFAGLISAILAYTLFDASLLMSLAIWVGSGPLSAALALIAPRGAAPAGAQGMVQSA
jgi:hypothetical protein